MKFIEKLGKKTMLLDGAMGTMEIKYGLTGCPEMNNLLNADAIMRIHKEYVKAGADIIETSTFGANRIKLNVWGVDKVKDINYRAVELAKKASEGRAFVAGNIGPTGKLLEPLGEVEFDEAYDAFYEQAKYLIDAGADLILIETMSVLNEARAALLAAKQAGDIPVLCSMTFSQNGRTLAGNDVETVITVLEALGADGIGINCSLGPDKMADLVDGMLRFATKPVFVEPNAGRPVLNNNMPAYPVGPDEFSDRTVEFAKKGAAVIGGCCGTTPDHIKLIREKMDKINRIDRINEKEFALASSYKTYKPDGKATIIGQCINCVGKEEDQEDAQAFDTYVLVREAKNLAKAGADIIDIKLSDKADKAVIIEAIRNLESTLRVPLCIDSKDAEVIECALRHYQGKALINSVNGTRQSLKNILPVAKKYGAAVIGVAIDESKTPKTAEERLKIAEKIVKQAISEGIPKEDIMIDIAAGTFMDPADDAQSIDFIKLIKERLNVKTVAGADGICQKYGEKAGLDASSLFTLLHSGLDAVIIDPHGGFDMKMIKENESAGGKDKF